MNALSNLIQIIIILVSNHKTLKMKNLMTRMQGNQDNVQLIHRE